MATRDLPINEFVGWAIKTGTVHSCTQALELSNGEALGAIGRKLARSVIDAYNRSSDLTTLAAADVTSVGAGLLQLGLLTQEEYDELLVLIDKPNEIDKRALEAIDERALEVAHYQLNIDNYTMMLDGMKVNGSLPEWPENLRTYKSWEPQRVHNECPDIHFQAVIDLQYMDRIKSLLRSEKAEQSKAQKVLEALIARQQQGIMAKSLPNVMKPKPQG